MLQGVCSPKQTGVPRETFREILKAKATNFSLVKFGVHSGCSVLCTCYRSIP